MGCGESVTGYVVPFQHLIASLCYIYFCPIWECGKEVQIQCSSYKCSYWKIYLSAHFAEFKEWEFSYIVSQKGEFCHVH